MKTAISIPDPLFGAAERLAKRLGLSRSELFQRALQAFLQQHNDDGVTEALDKIYGPASEDGSLDPLLEQLQLASLPKDEWC
ncbi:MAG: ribbon-helix-helix protein, CopG family [Chloroflexi bacterium]|nr:ribbon-helix-helix protein, CopG family [Chloroflexota bacterium]